MTTHSSLHIDSTPADAFNPRPLYRIPHQASLDGNTVEIAVEQAAFAENALRLKTSMIY